jgi:CRISPR-associated endonuclease/helicase Cas3
LGTVIEDKKARELLYAPIVTCTVDHIMGASENTRGGRHIVPILRLLTSDLVLDEPDDFSQEDLPALSRLVFMSGMLGSKVLLSSATLTPDLIAGLYSAYQAGRAIWNQHMGISKQGIICAWFDEFGQQNGCCSSGNEFIQLHESFVASRCSELSNEPARRIASILPIELPPPEENQKLNYAALAGVLLKAATGLHNQYYEQCPDTGKTASIGLIRIANIGPLVRLAQSMYAMQDKYENIQIHLCCYHARQLLILRDALETKLDRILNRTDYHSIFDHIEIKQAVQKSTAQHHIFVVLASPVAEVGRDHDYDWAIIDPSSMRSVIQLVGRVWRHRPDKVTAEPNVLIMQSNIKALEGGKNLGVGKAVFTHPGFEEAPDFLLETHLIHDLIPEEQLNPINAIARISKPEESQSHSRLADLEHAVMAWLLNNQKTNFVSAFWKPETANHASVHLQLVSPFRFQDRKQEEFVSLPDSESDSGFCFKYAEQAWLDMEGSKSQNHFIQFMEFECSSPSVKPWLTTALSNSLESLAKRLPEEDLNFVALRYATVQLTENERGWNFHPWLGFWEC